MLFDKATTDREFGNHQKITDNYPKYVITMDEHGSGSNNEGVMQLHLRDFLVINNL